MTRVVREMRTNKDTRRGRKQWVAITHKDDFSRAAGDMRELLNTTKHLPLSFICPLSAPSCVHLLLFTTGIYSFCSTLPAHFPANHFSLTSLPSLFLHIFLSPSQQFLLYFRSFFPHSSMLTSFFFSPPSHSLFFSSCPPLQLSSSPVPHPLLYFSHFLAITYPSLLNVQGVWWTQEGGPKGVKAESWRLQRWRGPLLLLQGTQMSLWQILHRFIHPPLLQTRTHLRTQWERHNTFHSANCKTAVKGAGTVQINFLLNVLQYLKGKVHAELYYFKQPQYSCMCTLVTLQPVWI